MWLMDNGYDVGKLGPEVLHPYLAGRPELDRVQAEQGQPWPARSGRS